MKISLIAGNKEDEGPILPRFVSDSVIDLKDQDDKKGVKAEIQVEVVDQANLDSGKRERKASPVPHPTKTAMEKKAKKTSACQQVCGLIGFVILSFMNIAAMTMVKRGVVKINVIASGTGINFTHAKDVTWFLVSKTYFRFSRLSSPFGWLTF